MPPRRSETYSSNSCGQPRNRGKTKRLVEGAERAAKDHFHTARRSPIRRSSVLTCSARASQGRSDDGAVAKVANYGNQQIRRMRCRGSGSQGLPSQFEREPILNFKIVPHVSGAENGAAMLRRNHLQIRKGKLVSISNLNSKLDFSDD